MKAICVTSPSRQKFFLCDEVGAAAILNAYQRDRGSAAICSTSLIDDDIRFDGGGAMRMGEKVIKFEANGVKFSVTVTQFAFALEVARNAEVQEKYGGCIAFGGWGGI